ncbi:MAG: tRNA pseudouridine(55) synthase TruB [Candidatus Magasanikbacteria bacterium]|nr:tRNA pseudouridine(55) synthase TruB [Candidatus Magasanikbacteria bacterium]
MEEKEYSGFLLVDKPTNWTSHDVVGYLRGVTKIKKIGHAGTLDPFATGLLIVAVKREATKRIDEFKNLDKTYITKIKLGAETDTYDKTGKITKKIKVEMKPTKKEVEKVLKEFLGEQNQLPPMYSAKKVQGKKLYELAREGIEIKRTPHKITIKNIALKKYKYPFLTIEVNTTTGTYIRTLAFDIGKKLKTGAYCEELRRLAIGKYKVKKAKKIKSLKRKNWFKKLFQIS